MKMGLPFSSTGDDALDEGFDALLMRSINFNGDNMKPTLRSVSCNGEDSEPTILKAFSAGKLIIEGSLSFKSEETGPFPLETRIAIKSPTTEKENSVKPVFKSPRFWPSIEKCTPELPVVGPMSPKHEAALKLQKVYKSFRTRRQLADCAVIVEQSWWKLLDFALLKRSSVSYFDIEEPESAVSRWLRARRRAATVGKGSLKDEKAKKLALQHWLEAIDPRHRYGHNLHFYYNRWLQCESKQPFFYWLDVGEGKEVNLEAQCPRSKLQQQCIKYLGHKEREAYEVIVEDGKFLYKHSKELLDSSKGPGDSKWIFVLSTSKTLYVGQKKKGTFQHSSFLAGGATSAAGRLVLENGSLKAVWPHSGHYRPTEENFQEFMNFLKENNVDLTDVKQSPSEDDEESRGLKSFHSEVDLTQHDSCPRPRTEVPASHYSGGASNADILKIISSFEPSKGVSFSSSSAEYKLGRDRNPKRLLDLEQDHKLHKKIMLEHQEENDGQADGETKCFSESKRTDSGERCDGMDCSHSSDFKSRVSFTSEEHQKCCKQNLFMEEQEEGEKPSVPQESILRRINSKKGMKSYQLGKQLSCKWTTGAGPRIGCVRDYPSELQVHALEQLNLSPRTDENSRPSPSPRNTSNQSPRMPEEPFPEVPMLQKPNFRRYSRGLA